MEGTGNDKQNESDECDVNGDNRKQDDDDSTGQEDVERKMKAEDKRESLENMNLKNEMNTLKKTLSADDEDADEEDEGSKESADEEERKETQTSGEKKEQESSSDSTSTSSTDDESETSSEDKTEPSKPETVQTTQTEATSREESKESTSKTEDTTDDSDIEDDLVSAINYNTITSLAALKDMLQSSGEDSDGVDSFFHHYFLSHVNRLPSRNQTHSPYPWGRRLSECREEDEYETEEGKRIMRITLFQRELIAADRIGFRGQLREKHAVAKYQLLRGARPIRAKISLACSRLATRGAKSHST